MNTFSAGSGTRVLTGPAFVAFCVLAMPAAVVAGNDHLSGEAAGWTLDYSSEPPASVHLQRKAAAGADTASITFEKVNCSLEWDGDDAASFACDATGDSPLAGVRYALKERVGVDKNCMEEEVYDVFECVEGCDRDARTPKLLRSEFPCS